MTDLPASRPTLADSEVREPAAGHTRADEGGNAATRRAPERVGPYRIDRILGSGGMSVVYEGRHTKSRESAAVKVVRGASEVNLGAIRREVQALQRVEHPGVVKIVDTGVAEGLPWYAMELLTGPTLRAKLNELWGLTSSARAEEVGPGYAAHTSDAGGRLRAAGGHLPQFLQIVFELCDTLGFLHGQGLVHKDLKPENVILEDGNRPVLFDFGLISQLSVGHNRETLEGEYALAGTPGYMAPEQILQETVDARADLYALGCMMYEGITGQRPFGSAKAFDLVQRHLYETPRPPSEVVGGVPPELDALVLRLLARRPQARVGHASDVAAVLARVLGIRAGTPNGAGPTYLYRPTLAGRAESLTRLEGWLYRAENQPGILSLVGGRSGIGKTRLAVELMTAAARRRIRVLEGACLPPSLDSGSHPRVHASPLLPFRGLLRAIADTCRREGRGGAGRLLGDRLGVLAAYAPALSTVPGAESCPEAPALSAEAGTRRLLEYLALTMTAFAKDDPFLLVIDDVQWCDPLTRAFIEALAAGELDLQGVMLLGTYRSDEAPAWLQAVAALETVHDLQLEPLQASEVRSMVEDMLASDEVPDSFVDYLTRASRGNPFFVAEYLRSAVEEGVLRRALTGGWVVAGAGESERDGTLPLPESVEALVDKRIEGLESSHREVLECATVLGREFTAERLYCLVSGSFDELLVGLRDLMALDFLEETQQGEYAFAHDKIRELGYRRLPVDRRRALHGAAATDLETGGVEIDLPSRARLAEHWHLAGDRGRAFAHLVAAADAAVEAMAPQSAVTFYARALDSLDRPDSTIDADALKRAEIEHSYAWACYCVGDVERFLRHSNRALTLLGAGLPPESANWRSVFVRQLLRHAAHQILPAPLLEVGDHRRDAMHLAAETASRLSWGYIYANQPTRALAASLLSSNLADRAGSIGPKAVPYTMLGATAGTFGMSRVADRYFEVARLGARLADTLDADFVQKWMQSMHHINHAEWSRADDLVHDVLDRCRAAGDSQGIVNSLQVLAISRYFQGDLEESLDFATRAKDLASANAYRVLETVARCHMASVYLADERHGRALPLLAARSGNEDEGALNTINLHALLAGAFLRAENFDEALATADETRALLEAHPSGNMFAYPAHLWLPEVYLSCWERAEDPAERRRLAAIARKTITWVRRFARMYPVGRPLALRHRARELELLGRMRPAQSLREQAALKAQSLGMRHEGELARRSLAVASEA